MKQKIKECIRNFNITKDIWHVIRKESILTLFRSKEYKFRFFESKLLVVAHSLEKGMGIKDTRKGFGQQKANTLCDYTLFYISKNPNSLGFALIETVGILQAYVNYQKNDGVEIPAIENKLSQIKNKLSQAQLEMIDSYRCGYSLLNKEEFNLGKEMDFETFLKSRHSMRDFSEKELDKETILEAVRLANFAPSACNRQPSKVYAAIGKEQAQKVDQFLTGNKAFTTSINNFLVVTCDRAYFNGNEQYQWYVNGGIYLHSLVLALHSLGIGSCIMQWFAFSKTENDLKRLLGIKDTEAIIAVLCVGYYPDEMKCLCAQRKSSDETVIFLK